jgi:hypothetical protein
VLFFGGLLFKPFLTKIAPCAKSTSQVHRVLHPAIEAVKQTLSNMIGLLIIAFSVGFFLVGLYIGRKTRR